MCTELTNDGGRAIISPIFSDIVKDKQAKKKKAEKNLGHLYADD